MSKETQVVATKRKQKKLKPRAGSLLFTIVFVFLLVIAVICGIIIFTPLFNFLIEALGHQVQEPYFQTCDFTNYVYSHAVVNYNLPWPFFIGEPTSYFYSAVVYTYLYYIFCLFALFLLYLPFMAMGRIRLKKKSGKAHRYVFEIINLLFVAVVFYVIIGLPFRTEMGKWIDWGDTAIRYLTDNLFATGKPLHVLSFLGEGQESSMYILTIAWVIVATIVISVILHIIALAGGNKKKKKANKVPYYEKEEHAVSEEEETIIPKPEAVKAVAAAEPVKQTALVEKAEANKVAAAQIGTPVFITRPEDNVRPVVKEEPKPAPAPQPVVEPAKPVEAPKPAPAPVVQQPVKEPEPVKKPEPVRSIEPTYREVGILNALEPLTLVDSKALPGIYDSDVDAILASLEPKELTPVSHTPAEDEEAKLARKIAESLSPATKPVDTLPGFTEAGENPWEGTVPGVPQEEPVKEEVKEEVPAEEVKEEVKEAEPVVEEKPAEETPVEAEPAKEEEAPKEEVKTEEDEKAEEIAESLSPETEPVDLLPSIDESGETPWSEVIVPEEEKEEEIPAPEVEEAKEEPAEEVKEAPVEEAEPEEEKAEEAPAQEEPAVEKLEDVTEVAQPEAISEPIVTEIVHQELPEESQAPAEEAQVEEKPVEEEKKATTIAINALSEEDKVSPVIEQPVEEVSGEQASRYELRQTVANNAHKEVATPVAKPVIVYVAAPATAPVEEKVEEAKPVEEAPVSEPEPVEESKPEIKPINPIRPVAPMKREEEVSESQEEEKKLQAISGPLHAISERPRPKIAPVEARKVKFDLKQYRIKTYEGNLSADEAFAKGVTKVQPVVNPVLVNQNAGSAWLQQKRNEEIRKSGYTNIAQGKLVKPTRPLAGANSRPTKVTSIRDLVKKQKEAKEAEKEEEKKD